MTKIKFILKFSILLLYTAALAQELPPIENYIPENYKGGNQNWSLSQSDEKYIYVANNNGLLEFNGANWKLYPSPNGTIVRGVKVVNDLIYTGCYMEFGFWKRNEFGNLEYESLLPKLNEPLIEDEHFWNIINIDNWILFQSLDRIYIYNTLDQSFNIINSKTTRAKIFIVGNSIYFQKINEGIFKIENGKPVLVSNRPEVQKNVIVGAFSIDNKTLFLNEQGTFYFFEEGDLSNWSIQADKELLNESVYSSLQLNDGSFILGTISNGIFHIDQYGNVLRKINQKNGLNNNTVLSIFEDIDHNIWLGLDNGISVINLKSPFSVYYDLSGKLGTVHASSILNDKLYIGTNQGLFFKKLNTSDDFKLIKNTEGQVWSLTLIDGILFCGHNNGTFVINNGVGEQISNYPGTWNIKKIGKNNDLLLQGNYVGLSILEKKKGNWQFKNKIEGFNYSSRFFEIINDDQIIVNHEYKGIFLLEIDPDFSKISKLDKKGPSNYGSSIVSYKNNVIYGSKNGAFRYDLVDREFKKDSILSTYLFGENDIISGSLIAKNESNELWGFTDKNIIVVSSGSFDDTPQVNKIPIPSFLRRNLKLGYENVTRVKDDLYLIGTSDGYVILNFDKFEPKNYSIKINTISKGFQHALKDQVSLMFDNNFKSNDNNLHFTFSVAEFDKFTEIRYQYKLQGLYNEWSNWISDSYLSFENLPHGDYTLSVRGLIGNEISENTATYEFIIEKPWYLSNLMIVIYGLIFLGLLYINYYFYKRHYNRRQLKLLEEKQREFKVKQLESEKVIMELKNEKLKQEVESKNRELTISTMSIIKKNEILNSIKRELLELNTGDSCKQAIKTIDKNINNKKDWEFLENAFNNADKDFLKKVKSLHPELTPNDLRFCAYLRLNLSSKEIAPLLNISVRSVEIKRYRLRKKINLPHEKSLVEYILEI